jgi:hypothetical protein
MARSARFVEALGQPEARAILTTRSARVIDYMPKRARASSITDSVMEV